ncbi:hypothetical protein [Gordonia terrae]
MTTASTAVRISAVNVKEAAVVILGGLLLLVSLIGPTWLILPDNPAAGTPALPVGFTDLTSATEASPSAVQAFFFGWPAWAFLLVLIGAGIGTVLTANRILAAITAFAALIALFVAVFALKGPLTWGQTLDTLPNVRIGSYLYISGILVILAYAVVKAIPRGPRT